MSEQHPESSGGTPGVPAPPARPKAGHKGTFGTVIVLGGSETMPGAPALCAAGALRAGAGLVKLAARAEVLPWSLVFEPSATGIALDPRGDGNDVMRSLDEADPRRLAVLAVGPGLGRSRWADEAVLAVLAGPRRVVLDADALNALAGQSGVWPHEAEHEVVLTPHPGEFARLAASLGINESPTAPAQRPTAARAMAKATGAVVVLKGDGTIVADAVGHTFINTTGNPALATAGSGDILTGIIASLVAQGMRAFNAACLGVHVHGLAADLWAESNGPSGLTARDLAALVPRAMNQLRITFGAAP